MFTTILIVILIIVLILLLLNEDYYIKVKSWLPFVNEKESFSTYDRWLRAHQFAKFPNPLLPSSQQVPETDVNRQRSGNRRGDVSNSFLKTSDGRLSGISLEDKSVPDTSALPVSVQSGIVKNPVNSLGEILTNNRKANFTHLAPRARMTKR
jgi:hypothetical protein